MTTSWLVVLALLAPPAGGAEAPRDPAAVRIATYNIWELTADKVDAVDAAGRGTNPQLQGAAEVIQRVRPDILLINEIDYDPQRNVAALFRERYLAVPQNGQAPIDFPHIFYQPVNTGVPTEFDLDHDGKKGGPGDAQGYGRYPGQYGMALLSRYPLTDHDARTFQRLLWKDQPGNLMPDGTGDKPAWYSAEEAKALRLSSKSHWDVPVRLDGHALHVLCAHPTPPVFDGAEDRNGRRNFDELRLWVDYLSGGAQAEYLVDDAGQRGGLAPSADFVILGDLNADPLRDPVTYGEPGIRRLLDHPRVQDPMPTSAGAAGQNPPGPPAFLERKTCDFGRIDYTLCSKNLKVLDSGVFWPASGAPAAELMSDRARSSDHRLVWVDVKLP